MEDKNFDIIYHTADIGIKVWGKNLRELFKNAAIGLFELISDREKVFKSKKIDGISHGEDDLELLVNFLNDIIYLFETLEMVFCDIVITSFKKGEIAFSLFGEKIDIKRHSFNFSVKACTYHGLEIVKKGEFLEANIIFDT